MSAITVKEYGPDPVWPAEDFVYERKNNAGYAGHLTPKEEEALQQLRAKNYTCKEAESGAFTLDDDCLLRFLRARKFDLTKADLMLTTHLTWRDKMMPSEIHPKDLAYALTAGMVYFGPYTRTGLPTIVVDADLFDPSKIPSMEYFSKFCAFFFQRAIGKLPRGVDKAILIFDLAGFSLYRHANPYAMKLILELVGSVQANNPERLEEIIIYRSPMLFSGVWKVVKPLLDPVVAAKISFTSSPAKFLELVVEDQLPVKLGGKRELPYPNEGQKEIDEAQQQQ